MNIHKAGSYPEKYKDDLPLNTIKRIRQILSDLGLLLVEQWINSVEGIYSVRLEIVSTGVGQNGKGTSPAYALASAYGEFIERLQNRVLYQEIDLDPAVLQEGGFYYAPDEKLLSIEELLQENSQLTQVLLKSVTAEEGGDVKGVVEFAEQAKAEDLLAKKVQQWFPEVTVKDKRYQAAQKWMVANPAGCPADFVALPFYNVKADDLCYVPYQMLRIPVGSNGTCAGNTPEEALVQGISEIMERHVHQQIFDKKFSPPTIPNEYIQQYPTLYERIQRIEQNGRFKVIIKDCSLEQDFPVVGVVLVDPQSQGYFVRLGAHPTFAIALERCLTELLQGKDLNHELSQVFTPFDYSDRKVDQPLNKNTLLRIGKGSYPKEFFASNFSYEFKPFKDVSGFSNPEMLRYLTDLILSKGYTLLVRDVSYLGFPSYQVMVPGISEVYDFFDNNKLVYQTIREEVKKTMRHLPTATDRELRQMISYLIRRQGYIFEADTFTRLLGFPVTAGHPWEATPAFLFISAALYKMDKIKEAYGFMRQLAAATQAVQNQGDPGFEAIKVYYRSVRDFLGARVDGLSEDEIAALLTNFYPESVVEQVLTKWRDPQRVLQDYGHLNCWNCTECNLGGYCAQPQLKELHQKLKERQAQNTPDQKKLKEVFTFFQPCQDPPERSGN